MKRIAAFLTLAFALLVISNAAVCYEKKNHEIREPTFGQPAFALPGGDIEIKIRAAGEGTLKSVTILSIDRKEIIAKIAVDSALKPGANGVSVQLPDGVAPGLYDLCARITYDISLEDCRPSSVAVVESFDPPFKFVQITDFHVGDPRATRQFPGVDIDRVRVAALETANKLNPRFVLFTGDLVAYPNSYEVDYPEAKKKILDHLKVPTIIIPGNHDLYSLSDDDGVFTVDGNPYWEDTFGPSHRVLDFGAFRFIAFNTYGWNDVTRNKNRDYQLKSGTQLTYQGTLTKSEYRWVVRALKTAGDRIPLLVAHHGPRQFEIIAQQWCSDCISQIKFMSLINRAKVPYYIFGHIHRNSDYVERNTRYISTTSTGSDVDKDDTWAIREFQVNEDLTIDTRVITLFDSVPMLADTTE